MSVPNPDTPQRVPIALIVGLFLALTLARSADAQAPTPAPNGNDVSLKEFVLRIFAEQEKQTAKALAAQEKATADALAAQDKANTAALNAAKEAVNKAESAAEKRFDSVNEFRSQLKDQAATFMSRTEYDANHKQLSDQVTALLATDVPRSEHENRWKSDDERFRSLEAKIDNRAREVNEKLDVITNRQFQGVGRTEGTNWLWGILAGAAGIVLAAAAFMRRNNTRSTNG